MKRQLVLNILLAVVYASIATTKDASFGDRVTKAIKLLNIPDVSSGGADESSLLLHLKTIIFKLLTRSAEPVKPDEFIMSLESTLLYHPEVVSFIRKNITDIDDIDQEEINRRLGFYNRDVRNYLDIQDVATKTTELSFKIRDAHFLGDRKLVAQLVADYTKQTENFRAISGSEDPMLQISGIREISGTDDEESMDKAFEDAEVTYEGKGLLSLGCQGWNDSFGPLAKIPRGVMIEIQALSGCSKSETMRRILIDICRFNRPYLFNSKAKPVVLYFTAEDTTGESWDKIFKQLYCESKNVFPTEDESRDRKRKISYVNREVTRNGIDFNIISCRKNETTIEDAIEVLEAYKSRGYEVIACGIDYMGLFKHSHYDASMLETFKIQRKHSVIGGYCKENKITVFVANQLGTGPAQELADETDDFARAAAVRGFSVGSNRILDELDGRIVVHVKEGPNGKYYHQWCTSKLRWAKGWKLANKYCTYEMHSIDGRAAGFVLSDYGLESKACRDMTGSYKSGAESGDTPF